MSERSKPSAFKSPSSSAKSSLSHSAQLAERSASNRNAFICASLSSSARATGTQTTRIQKPGSEFEEDPKRGNAGQARRPSSKHHSARWLSRKESGTQHRWTSRPCHLRRRSGCRPEKVCTDPSPGAPGAETGGVPGASCVRGNGRKLHPAAAIAFSNSISAARLSRSRPIVRTASFRAPCR